MEVWARSPESVDAKMLWEACCLGFFAFLGAGKFTYDTRFDKAPPLTVQDLAVDDRSSPSMMTVHLRRTKTDQFGRGVTLRVGTSYGTSLLSGCCYAQLSGYKIYKGRPTFHLCKWNTPIQVKARSREHSVKQD